ncbi:MAG: magnesium transporter [Bacteroidia bacterium]
MYLNELSSEDISAVVSHLDVSERNKLLTLVKPEYAADMMDDIPWVQALDILEELNAKEAAAIINEMRSDEQVDFLAEMDKEDASAIMEEMEEEEVENVKKLIQYDSECAGGLMITEFLAFDESKTVGAVVKSLSENSEKYKDFNLQYIYVTAHDKFVGVLQTRGLLLSKENVPLSKIVLRDALTVNDTDTIEELISFFDKYDFYGVPVINNMRDLVGVVLRKDIREVEAEKANVEHLETQGIVGGEELRTMSVWLRARRMFSWLSVNILLNIMAAIVAFYQDTLRYISENVPPISEQSMPLVSD